MSSAHLELKGVHREFGKAETKIRVLESADLEVKSGELVGLETVAETGADPGIRAYLEALMRDEIAPTLDGPAGIDLNAYIAALLAWADTL